VVGTNHSRGQSKPDLREREDGLGGQLGTRDTFCCSSGPVGTDSSLCKTLNFR